MPKAQPATFTNRDSMLTVDAALQKILDTVASFEPQPIPLDDALGLILADDVISDVDSPPFDKALMDGYAVRAADVADGSATLRVVDEVTAGQVAQRSVQPGEAIRIMTGAPLPDGADAVVRVEDTRFDDAAQTVALSVAALAPGADLMRRGESMQQGQTILQAGCLLKPQQLGALAEMGVAKVSARRRPQVAILATGDELVPVAETPGPGQIRNSNETMLTAQAKHAGADAIPLGIARDNRSELREKIRTGLHSDVLLLSGGVSAGKLDLVPSELETAGVKQVFHKVQVKPGKPLWFGVCETDGKYAANEGTGRGETGGRGDANRRCYVFGLPGNPVSSMVCFEIFVRTALWRLMGAVQPLPQPVVARLTHAFSFRNNRQTYLPCRLEWTETGPVVELLPWGGSADLQSTVSANGMAVFPPEDVQCNAGDAVDVIGW